MNKLKALSAAQLTKMEKDYKNDFTNTIVKNALTQRLFSLEGRKIRRAKLSSKEF